MATIQNYSKNANKLIGNNMKTNTESYANMCETTYLFLNSVQYISSEDEHKADRQKCNVEEHSKNNVTVTLKTMELKDSGYNEATNDENKELKNNYNIENKPTGNRSLSPPVFTCWHKTLNNAMKILDQGSDIPIDTIAKHLQEKHAHETYVESLRKITGNNMTWQEINGVIQIKMRYGILHVPMDNFQSYLHCGNETQCLVCKTTFPDVEADIHKYEVRHINQVVKNVDCHGMRKLDYIFNHCIICNLLVRKKKETKAHIKKRQHAETYELLTKPFIIHN